MDEVVNIPPATFISQYLSWYPIKAESAWKSTTFFFKFSLMGRQTHHHQANRSGGFQGLYNLCIKNFRSSIQSKHQLTDDVWTSAYRYCCLNINLQIAIIISCQGCLDLHQGLHGDDGRSLHREGSPEWFNGWWGWRLRLRSLWWESLKKQLNLR